MTPDGRRERARLRSERWRRAHGIMPRRPAQRPWLAEGISRSGRLVSHWVEEASCNDQTALPLSRQQEMLGVKMQR